MFLIQVLAGKRLIANFPRGEYSSQMCVCVCARREHLIGLQTADARAAWGYFQTSFITSFWHQLQNGVGKIDGWRRAG